MNNIIDVEGKVKQKENNETDNFLKSKKENGDLVRHEDSTEHSGVPWRMRTKIPYKKIYRHEI